MSGFRARPEHWEVLLDYMQEHPDFARGRLNKASSREKYRLMWQNISSELNALGYGERTVDKWQKAWTDYRSNVKKKAAEIRRQRGLTGGGIGVFDNLNNLTEVEMKMLSIMGETCYKGVGVKEKGIIPLTTHQLTKQSNPNQMDQLSESSSESLSLLTHQIKKPSLIVREPSKGQYSEFQDFTAAHRYNTSCATELKTSATTYTLGPSLRQVPPSTSDKSQKSTNLQDFDFKCGIGSDTEQITPGHSLGSSLKNSSLDVNVGVELFTANPATAFDTIFNKKRESGNNSEAEQVDHDYLAVPQIRPGKRRSTDKIENIYMETLTTLKKIDRNVEKVSQSVDTLTSEIKLCFQEMINTLKNRNQGK